MYKTWNEICNEDGTIVVGIRTYYGPVAKFVCELKFEDDEDDIYYEVIATCVGGDDCPFCEGYEVEFELLKEDIDFIEDALEWGIEEAVESDRVSYESRGELW